MSPTLTPKKKKILDFIQNYSNKNGYSPTLEEIAKKFKLSSLATVHQHIDELEKSGYLKRDFNKARDIQIIEQNEQEESYLEGSVMNLPIAGLITAGEPIEAIEDNTETLTVPKEILKNENAYVLKVKGDSMIESLISDGDFVVVQKQDTAQNGDIVVALLEDGSATLKEFHREKNYIRLQPRNKKYTPIKVKNVVIQGKVAGIIRKF
ncbi:MAG: transcriptional repressor LexA [Patescibacteria group bacterium]|nr:transcriptional repressor LexA [Patescibacteria group bacterium]